MNTRTASTLILLFFSLLSVAQTPEWKYMYKGNKAFENKDFQKAERHYLNVLKKNPKSAEALFNLGNTQLGLNNAQAAMEYYEKFKQCFYALMDFTNNSAEIKLIESLTEYLIQSLLKSDKKIKDKLTRQFKYEDYIF